MIIRKAQEGDAADMLDLFAALDTETEFMMFEPGERTTTLEQQKERIKSAQGNSHAVLYVVESSSKLAGFAAGFSPTGRRNQHLMRLVIGIRESHWRQGLGRRLICKLEHWAVSNGKTKVELTVLQNNTSAIGLYKSQGFEEEGLKRCSVLVRGQYYDEYYMGKLLDN